MPALGSGALGAGLHVAGGFAGRVATFALVTVGWGLFVMPVDRFLLMLGRFM
jgi:hypothetical protein